LRHAQARNVIERIFGVLKKRFAILNKPIEYSTEDQAQIVQALGVIHNFIRIHDPDDIPNIEACLDTAVDPSTLASNVSRAERDRATQRRDSIAKEMWASYQEITQRRQK
jgi:uncharacterized alpha-E superfamily protein